VERSKDKMKEMSEDEIMNLTIEDFRDLTPQERTIKLWGCVCRETTDKTKRILFCGVSFMFSL